MHKCVHRIIHNLFMLLIDFEMIVGILNLSEFAEWQKKTLVLCKDRAFPQLPRTYSYY